MSVRRISATPSSEVDRGFSCDFAKDIERVILHVPFKVQRRSLWRGYRLAPGIHCSADRASGTGYFPVSAARTPRLRDLHTLSERIRLERRVPLSLLL